MGVVWWFSTGTSVVYLRESRWEMVCPVTKWTTTPWCSSPTTTVFWGLSCGPDCRPIAAPVESVNFTTSRTRTAQPAWVSVERAKFPRKTTLQYHGFQHHFFFSCCTYKRSRRWGCEKTPLVTCWWSNQNQSFSCPPLVLFSGVRGLRHCLQFWTQHV